MKSSFSAIIYKTGINCCVDVPMTITAKMKAVKGYIPVTGTINGHAFLQTLVPVKDAPYRLFVNGPMLKGAGATLGEKARFTIEQNIAPVAEPVPKDLTMALKKNKLQQQFDLLSPSRQKEIFRYLNQLKTKESLHRNIGKVIAQLKGKAANPKGFLRNLKS